MSSYKVKIVQVPLLGPLSPPLRGHVADIFLGISNARVLRKGEQLYAEGAEDLNTGAILVDGSLLVAAGAHEPVTVTAPEILGEMQQYNAYGTRTATVCAKDGATVLEFSWHDFVARVKDRPGISHSDQDHIRDAFEKVAGHRFKLL
jgi:hypothetical protein